MKGIHPFFCLFILMTSCSSRRDNYELLQGEWRNVSLQLFQYSYANGPNDSTLIIKKGDWESVMQMKPIRTTFENNGTYVSRYYNLSDSLIFEADGHWYFIGDSLHLISEEGNNRYLFEMIDDRQARFVSKLDWDSDGLSDDLYDGIQQKQ